jgi:outer membrane protein OmpA-like peptidoglycan-associated protein
MTASQDVGREFTLADNTPVILTWRVLPIGLVLAGAWMPARAQDMSRTYTDSRGKAIVFPLGDASFADEVVSFEVGKPPPRDSRWAKPDTALGPPDYNPKRVDPSKPANVVLGCAGTLTVRFTDNVLHDVPGPDLYVFEVGPAIEPMQLAISPDGTAWTEVGNISGGTATIDIGKMMKPGERFRYVRVTDLKRGCGGPYPGADVDSIGAIGSALQLSFDASVLFDFNRSELRPEAQARLSEAATRVAAYANASVTVEGHTDNVGTDAYNTRLSLARASAVRALLLSRPELRGRSIAVEGFGARRPIASNATDDGRQQNRRVEILVMPRP